MKRNLLALAAALAVADIAAAATITLNPGDNIAIRLNSARPGDVAQFAAGTFNLGAIAIPAGITLQGTPNFTSHLVFTLAGQNLYGMVLAANASNVTITGLDFISSNGVLGMYQGNGFAHIHFTGNRMQFGGGTTANNTGVFGIYGSVGCNDLQITNNFFHDSPNSVRTWEVWNDSNSNLDHNTYFNVVDGGHLMEPQNNCSFSYNTRKQLRRMAQEIQGNSPSSGLRVVGNVFSDWVSPYYDSFGLSVVNDKSSGTLIDSNDLRATIAAGSTWGIADTGGAHRFGYGIEAGGNGIIVQNNTLVGDWIAGVCASTPATLQNNKKFGPANWGDWTTEAAGKIIANNNTVNRNLADAPPAPTTAPATAATQAAVAQPAIPNNPFQLTASVIDSSNVSLSWVNAPPGNLLVNTISTVGRETGDAVGPTNLPATSSPMIVSNLHPGWQIDLQLTAADGTTSTVATVQMPAAAQTAANVTISSVDTVLHLSDGSTRISTTQP